MSLGTLHRGIFRVVKPIPVIIDRFEGGFTASWAEVSEYGCGDTPSEARNDLCRSIAASFFHFENAMLGPGLQRDWRVIREHVVRSGPPDCLSSYFGVYRKATILL